jgi:hypothetical protein
MPPTLTTESIPCPRCRYPVQAPSYVGQTVKCPYCGTINEAIEQVPTSTTVLACILVFIVGCFVGPAVIVSSKGGQEWLEKKAREHFK